VAFLDVPSKVATKLYHIPSTSQIFDVSADSLLPRNQLEDPTPSRSIWLPNTFLCPAHLGCELGTEKNHYFLSGNVNALVQQLWVLDFIVCNVRAVHCVGIEKSVPPGCVRVKKPD
jgi:hypothetical protein